MTMHARNRQRGQYLIIALLALIIMALGMAEWARTAQRRHINAQAAIAGKALAQWGIGIRGFVAAAQAKGALPAGNPMTETGVAWLKSPNCGGLAGNPDQGYVPCAFSGGRYGPHYTTTLTLDPATNAVTARTWFVALPENGQGEASRGDMATRIANTALAGQQLPQTGMFVQVFSNAAINATAQPDPGAITASNRGRVLLVANNAPSNDIWLRVDGTNQMLADLNMGGHSIDHAQNGDFAGNLRVHGVAQIDGGLVVDSGPADFRAGVSANDVTVESVGHTVSQGVYTALVETGSTSYTVAKPACPAGETPGIFTSLQSTGAGADALYASRVVVTDSGSNWVIQPQRRTSSFSLTESQSGDTATITLHKNVSGFEPAPEQTVVVMTKCR